MVISNTYKSHVPMLDYGSLFDNIIINTIYIQYMLQK